MTDRASELLQLLELELDILEKGGAGRSSRDPHKGEPILKHSVACINHWLVPDHSPDCCDECVLLDFVPQKSRAETVPCHFIPLDEQGLTIDDLDRTEDDEEVVEKVKAWLRKTIERLKTQGQSAFPEEGPKLEY